MASDLEKKREEVKKLYPQSKSWIRRVNKMSADQVVAIYLRYRAQGKLGK